LSIGAIIFEPFERRKYKILIFYSDRISTNNGQIESISEKSAEFNGFNWIDGKKFGQLTIDYSVG